MKTYLDCIPCFFKQGLSAARIAGLGVDEQKRVLDKIAMIIPDIPMDASPAEIGLKVYRVIRESSGVKDPYKRIKNEYINFVLKLYPELKRIVRNSLDPLLSAVRVAIAGNIIDFGVGTDFNVEETLKETMSARFAILDYEPFKKSLKRAKTILYIGDNAGESVFDRVLIEEMGGDVIYAVREEPIINDVTKEDAKRSGLSEVARIVSSGSPAPGTVLSLCNKEFLSFLENADLVVSKGQGNYETLSEVDREVYFLVKAKCPVIAQDMGVEEQSIVLKRLNNEDNR